MSEKIKINRITIDELFSDEPIEREKTDWLFNVLNSEPKKEWVMEHPEFKGYLYLPIDKIELMLGRIFIRYNIEVIREGVAFNGNGVFVVVRIHYFDVLTEKMAFMDGVGAYACKTKEDLQGSFPIAKTNAIKDAADHFGKVFGRDLNRNKTNNPFAEMLIVDDLTRLKALFEAKKEKLKPEDCIHIERIIEGKEKTSYKKVINQLEKVK